VQPLRRRFAAMLWASTLVTGMIIVISPGAGFAACTETTKFVTETANNPNGGGQIYFGNRGAAYTFNHLPICSPGEVAESFFMRLSPDYTNWVETGAYQRPSDDSAHTHEWGEWRYYPNPVVVNLYDAQAGVLTTGTWYSWMLTNGANTSWNLYIVHSASPNGATWKFIANTGNLAAFAGRPESELSRYGTGNAQISVGTLQEQASFNGGWALWRSMACDNSQRSILDWTVIKQSNSSWYMEHRAPGVGEC
jgi:hypothetical protein